MGSACCVAAKEKTISNGAGGESWRNVRHSPSWSFQWDNRGRVAGEDTSISWFHEGVSGGDGVEDKSEARASLGEALYSGAASVKSRNPVSDSSISRNAHVEVNERRDTAPVSDPSTTMKSFTTLPKDSSLPSPPLSSQGHLLTSSLTPSIPSLSRQVSDGQISELKSPIDISVPEERPTSHLPTWSNESARGSLGGSSDGCSTLGFPEFLASTHRERWSLDFESFDKMTRSRSQVSASPFPSADVQTCGICLKLLTEKSAWISQRVFLLNGLSVVAILNCGHVFHADCLESMTPEVDKYDPACPLCTFGEKQTMKLFQKTLKAGIDSKARHNKRALNHIMDDFVESGRVKGGKHGGKGPKFGSSSSLKLSMARPFLRRRFSFGSKGTAENESATRKVFSWGKSSKM